jgi:TonB-linked SusC/RagA family outer membrane protein
MQFLQFIISHLKKGLLVPVFSCTLAHLYAQQTSDSAALRETIFVSGNQNDRALKGVEVKGTITDAATKKPLRAIRVTYQNYSAAITDSMGDFSLHVPNYNVAIILEAEGYQAKEIALKGRRTVSAALYEDSYNSFYDAAMLPFGKLANNQLPFAATSIQTGGNWSRTAETPDAFLQGKVAGLNVIRRSGTPNSGANLFMRGINSLYTTNQPLIVIDGVIFDAADYGGSIISNNYTNPLAYIDIKDIDNLTIIKDGSSTYGTKGANGVILITTARAKELATRIDLAFYGGVNFAPKTLPLLNAGEYRTYLSDILQSGGMTESDVRNIPYMIDDPSYPQYYRYHNQTDWQKQVFSRSSLKNYYIKVTGGDNIAKYALSLGYLTNSGVIKNTDMSRYNIRFNADLNLSRRMTATSNLSFTYNEQNLKDQGLSLATNPIYTALIKSPFINVNEVSDKGVQSPDITDADIFNASNPYALINTSQGLNKNYRFLGSILFKYSFSPVLSLNNQTAITIDKIRENIFIPRKGVTDDTLSDGTIVDSRLGSQTKRILALYNDLNLTYDRTIQRIHHLSTHAGVRFQSLKSEQDFVLGANSATDQLRSVGNGVAALRQAGGDLGRNRWLNTYVNANYSLSDKYFLSLNIAVDGSSRFGKNVPDALSLSDNSFAVMPSIAGAWLISSEKFMANTPFIDLLKLRASYGVAGNDDIGNFNARQYYVSQNFLGTQGLVRGNFGNDQLQWENVYKVNVGLDVALFNERLNLAVDAYRNRTKEMLVKEDLPTASGMSYAFTNSGVNRTLGAEASLTGRIINKQSLKWDLGFSLAHYKSTIRKLPGYEILTNYADATILSRVRNAPNVFYGYKTNGVYSSDAEASSEGLSVIQATGTAAPFMGGDIRFADMNGDKIIDDNDRQIIGDPNPDFFGSVTNRLEWKGLSLETFFTFSQGNDIYNYTRRQLESQSNFNNQAPAVINRWRNNGQVTEIPRASLGDPKGNSRFSDRWIEDGSYFRLRAATISYNLPIKAGFLRYSVLYVTGNNLLTLTNYLGFDPEMSATTSVLGQGVDVTLEPQYRSVQLGVRFGL